MVEAAFVRVTERDDLETRNLHHVIKDLMRARAGPDETQCDTPVRAVGVVERGPGAAAHPQRQASSGARRGAAPDELSAIDSVRHDSSPWERHEWDLLGS